MLLLLSPWKYYLGSFFLLGCIVYFPTFFNGFVWDDIGYIINNQQLHQFNISIFFDNVFNSDYIYRQTMAFYYAFFYTLFGANPLPYHIIQLLLHIIVVTLIFFLFNHFMNKKTAYILSLLFLIHPINAETVYWISSTQTQLYTIFGLVPLLLIQRKILGQREYILLTLFIFLCLLTYELGILYVLLVLFYLTVFKSPYLKIILQLALIIIVVYAFFRLLSNAYGFHLLGSLSFTQPTIPQTLLTIPSIIGYYFKTLLYPAQLQIWQYWVINTFDLKIIIFIISIFSLIYFLKNLTTNLANNHRKAFYFFLIWFLIGMLPLLQIIPLHMTVADRWFYFPFIGLLGLVGTIFQYYEKHLKRYTSLFFILFIIVFCLFSIRTIVRGFDWKDDLTLYTHDLQYQPDHIQLNKNLAVLYLQEENYHKTIPYLEKTATLSSHNTIAYVYLGQIYSVQKEYPKAIYYLRKALQTPHLARINNGTDTYYLLALAYKENQDYAKIENLLTDKIITTSTQKNDLLYLRAEALYKLQNYVGAKKDIDAVTKDTYDMRIIKLEKLINEAL